MTVESMLRLIAGAFVTASVLAGIYVHAGFLWFTVFVGLNLLQSGFTNWCPMMTLLRKLPLEHRRLAEAPCSKKTERVCIAESPGKSS